MVEWLSFRRWNQIQTATRKSRHETLEFQSKTNCPERSSVDWHIYIAQYYKCYRTTFLHSLLQTRVFMNIGFHFQMSLLRDLLHTVLMIQTDWGVLPLKISVLTYTAGKKIEASSVKNQKSLEALLCLEKANMQCKANTFSHQTLPSIFFFFNVTKCLCSKCDQLFYCISHWLHSDIISSS